MHFQKNRKSVYIILILLLIAVLLCGGWLLNRQLSLEVRKSKVNIGIAWREDTDSEFYTNVVAALRACGVEPVLLEQVRADDLSYENHELGGDFINTDGDLTETAADIIRSEAYDDTNAEEVMDGIDAVVFTGGEDISPALYGEEWNDMESEPDFNAARDVSDYILMNYCIDEDIPVMGICRGMQMIAVVSGAGMIQDLATYVESLGLKYNYAHRREPSFPEEYRDYASHDVTIKENSRIFQIYETQTLTGVPSWHHQAVKSVEGTKLSETASSDACGISIIEGIERTDKTFIIGLQFHTEAAYVKHKNGISNADEFMDQETSLKAFRCLINAAA